MWCILLNDNKFVDVSCEWLFIQSEPKKLWLTPCKVKVKFDSKVIQPSNLRSDMAISSGTASTTHDLRVNFLRSLAHNLSKCPNLNIKIYSNISMVKQRQQTTSMPLVQQYQQMTTMAIVHQSCDIFIKSLQKFDPCFCYLPMIHLVFNILLFIVCMKKFMWLCIVFHKPLFGWNTNLFLLCVVSFFRLNHFVHVLHLLLIVNM